MNQKYYCYIYRDPETHIPFLVGKGTKNRAWDHLKRKDTHHAANKIRKILSKGLTPEIEIVPAVDEEFAYLLEQVLIEKFGRRDLKTGTLCNQTDGGDGFYNLDPALVKQRSDKIRGRPVPESRRINQSKALTGKKRNPLSAEHKLKISVGGTGLKRTEETCQNISKSIVGKTKGIPKAPFSAEHKENIRKVRTGTKHSEEAKANMRKPKSMAKNMRACTVDGITIYKSVGELVKALGSGKKTGSRSPSFRYV